MARSQAEWKEAVKALLKSELTRKQVTYRDLAERLRSLGVDDNELNINNKIARGGFSAVWFFQVMEAIGTRSLHLDRDD